MNDNDKTKFVVDKLHDIDANINMIYEKINRILEIMENLNRIPAIDSE